MLDFRPSRVARLLTVVLSLAFLAASAISAAAQICPQRPVGGGSESGAVGKVGGSGSTSATSTSVAPGKVHTLVDCHTPPSIKIDPVSSTLTNGKPFLVIEYCSPNYNIDMSTNHVTLNGHVIDTNSNDTTLPFPLYSQNPDTMPNSGFCGVTPRSGKTAQEIGRVPMRPGADTLVAYVCDDIANCATLTV